MKKITIKGIIVNAMPESFMQEFIDAGMITPVNVVVNAINESTEDITLYIDSQGGSVFAGNSIVNACKDWMAKTGKSITVEVGALAASMGAYLAVYVGKGKVKCAANAKFMFHGAASCVEGGKSALADGSDLLKKMDEDIMGELKALGVPEATFSPWFQEGRMGWLTAQEAKALGIVSEIIGETAPKAKLSRQFIQAATAAWPGFSVAALGDALDIEPEAEAKPDPVAVVPPVPGITAAVVAIDPVARIAELEAKLADSITTVTAAQAELVTVRAELTASVQQVEAEKLAHAATAKALADLKAVHARACPMGPVTGSGAGELEPDPTGTDADKAKWEQAVAQHGYSRACRMFPKLRDAMIR